MDKMRPCPFCNYASGCISYKQVEFLGQNDMGIKKIKFRFYSYCPKCRSRGRPVTAIIDNVNEMGWETRMIETIYPNVIDGWNRRAFDVVDGEKPCKYAEMGASCWECGSWKRIGCDDQIKDYNHDGTVNIVECRKGRQAQDER